MALNSVYLPVVETPCKFEGDKNNSSGNMVLNIDIKYVIEKITDRKDIGALFVVELMY